MDFMLLQIEIRTRVDTFQFFKAHWKIKFDITGCVCIMGQLNVVMKAVVLITQAQLSVPLHPGFLPVFIPLHLFAWTHKKLHFNLLKFAHAENELTGYNLVAEGLTNLCNTKRNLHSP